MTNEYSVMLGDSVDVHISEQILKPFGEQQIMAIIFLAHTTGVFQFLDFVYLAL
jgi:hypothetical protein